MRKSWPIAIFVVTIGNSLFAQEPVKPADPEWDEETPVQAEPGTTATPAQPAEAELDPETQRLIEEAKQKIIRERAEKIAAEKKAREDEAKRAETEKEELAQKSKESKLYLGAVGSLGVGLNSFHSTGFGFGGTMDVIAYERFGVHLGFSTGFTSTKGSQLAAGNATLTVGSGGSVGFLGVDLAAFFAFPKISKVEAALGGGLTVYKLSNSSLSFGSMLAPLIMASAYYPVVPKVQLGLLVGLSFPRASTLSAGGTDYTFDTKQSLTVMSLMLSVRLDVW